MIYLIAEIFIFLLLALVLGVAAGWLWRNLQASAREAAMQRRMLDSRARVPQMESTVRTWQQRLERALGELNFREMELAEHQEKLGERDRTVAELERACAELRQQLSIREGASASGSGTQPAATPAQAEELTLHPGDPEQAATDVSAAAGEALPVEDAAAEQARRELEAALAQTRDELQRVQRALTAEQRRVEELTQERELQRRALQALEQQLELVREGQSRAANG